MNCALGDGYACIVFCFFMGRREYEFDFHLAIGIWLCRDGIMEGGMRYAYWSVKRMFFLVDFVISRTDKSVVLISGVVIACVDICPLVVGVVRVPI